MNKQNRNESLLHEHVEFARRLAGGLVLDPATGEDLAQDALAAALVHPPREPGSERAFLRTILRRVASRARRTTQRRDHRERKAARPEAVASTDDLVAGMEIHRVVVDEVMKLPDLAREVLLLRFFDDLSVAQIAERLDAPIETIRTRIKRALARVRERLDARTGGERRDWLGALAALLPNQGALLPVPIPKSISPWGFVVGAVASLLVLAAFIASQRDAMREMYAYAEPVEEAEPESTFRPEQLALASVVGNSTFGTSSGAVDDTPPFATSLNLKLGEIQEMDLPDADVLQAIAKATEWKLGDLQMAALYNGLLDDGSDVLLARVPIQGSETGKVALLGLTPDMGFVAAGVIDGKGQPVPEWKHFAAGLKFHEVPRLEGAKSWASVETLRAAAEAGEGQEPGLFLALLDLQQAMNNQASVFNLERSSREFSEIGEAEMMAQAYSRTAELAPQLSTLLGDSIEKFEALALASAESAVDLGVAIEAKDAVAGRSTQRTIMGRCRACHELPSPASEDGLSAASSAKRVELGIGDGFYRVGHDLRIRHPDRERTQLIADALRVGALLIDSVE